MMAPICCRARRSCSILARFCAAVIRLAGGFFFPVAEERLWVFLFPVELAGMCESLSFMDFIKTTIAPQDAPAALCVFFYHVNQLNPAKKGGDILSQRHFDESHNNYYGP